MEGRGLEGIRALRALTGKENGSGLMEAESSGKTCGAGGLLSIYLIRRAAPGGAKMRSCLRKWCS